MIDDLLNAGGMVEDNFDKKTQRKFKALGYLFIATSAVGFVTIGKLAVNAITGHRYPFSKE